MDKWFKDILPDKDPYHNRGRDQMRKKGVQNSSACGLAYLDGWPPGNTGGCSHFFFVFPLILLELFIFDNTTVETILFYFIKKKMINSIRNCICLMISSIRIPLVGNRYLLLYCSPTSDIAWIQMHVVSRERLYFDRWVKYFFLFAEMQKSGPAVVVSMKN
jgi:hypothetical protein